MDVRIAAVVCSGEPDVLRACLTNIVGQSLRFERTIVVAWGNNRHAVVNVAQSFGTSEVLLNQDGKFTAPANRNLALDYISRSPPDFVAFIDDDTHLTGDWHNVANKFVSENGPGYCYASTVLFSEDKDTIQSRGHALVDGRPLDVHFKRNLSNATLTPTEHAAHVYRLFEEPQFPCANCGLVPWQGILRIREIEGQVWDPIFERMTCFDLGLKLQRLGYRCKLIPTALALHTGYLLRKNLSAAEIHVQLSCRILLYRKFLTVKEQETAFQNLRSSVERWMRKGYPHSQVKGQLIQQLNDAAMRFANKQRVFAWHN